MQRKGRSQPASAKLDFNFHKSCERFHVITPTASWSVISHSVPVKVVLKARHWPPAVAVVAVVVSNAVPPAALALVLCSPVVVEGCVLTQPPSKISSRTRACVNVLSSRIFTPAVEPITIGAENTVNKSKAKTRKNSYPLKSLLE